MEDRNILALYRERRESALTETAKQYGAYLNQVVYRILGSREDVEEVLSDTYLAAWNRIPPESPRVLRHYLSRIARNLAFDRLDYNTAQRRNPNMTQALEELDGCLPDGSQDLEKALEAELLKESINAFLATVNRRDCALFLGRYYYGMTVKELAEKLGLTQGKTKYRLSTLRLALKEHLQKEGIGV